MFELSSGCRAGFRKVLFSVALPPGHKVTVAGSFNDWDPAATPMLCQRGKGVYSVSIELAFGSYEYKFVIDGEWTLDEGNPNFYPNDFGTLNSVLVVD